MHALRPRHAVVALLCAGAFLALGWLGHVAASASLAPHPPSAGPPPALALADTIHALARDTPDIVRLDGDGRVLARRGLGEAPTALALVAPANRVVAVATGSRLAFSLRASDLGDVRARRLDFEPALLSPSPEGDAVAVASIAEGVVARLDPATLTEIARAEGLVGVHDLRFSPDGGRLYASTLDGARIVTLDAVTLRPLDELRVDARGIDHMSRTPDGRLGLAVAPGSGTVRRIDLTGMPRLDGAIALPDPPARAYLGEDGETAWLASTARAALYRVDLASGGWSEIALPGLLRTRAEEPFSALALVSTDGGLLRLDGPGTVRARAAMPEPVTTMLPIEGRAATVLLDESGALWRVGATGPLVPEPLSAAPPLFAITGVNDLAFCHGG